MTPFDWYGYSSTLRVDKQGRCLCQRSGNHEWKHTARSRKRNLPTDLLLGEMSLSYESIMSITLGRGSILWEEDGINCTKLTKSQIRYLYLFHYISQINEEFQFLIFLPPIHGLMLSSAKNNLIPQLQLPNPQIPKVNFGLKQF